MPWNRLRGDQSDRRRRHSALRLDLAEELGSAQEHEQQEQEQAQGNGNGTGSGSKNLSGKSTSVSDLDHGHNLQLSVSQGQTPYSPEQETFSSRPQRFSLLKFRHASDSQLSRTARSQARNPSPPMPTSELRPSSHHITRAMS